MLITHVWKGNVAYLHKKNTNSAGINPACHNERQNNIFVLAGPGKPWHIANNSWYCIHAHVSTKHHRIDAAVLAITIQRNSSSFVLHKIKEHNSQSVHRPISPCHLCLRRNADVKSGNALEDLQKR